VLCTAADSGTEIAPSTYDLMESHNSALVPHNFGSVTLNLFRGAQPELESSRNRQKTGHDFSLYAADRDCSERTRIA